VEEEGGEITLGEYKGVMSEVDATRVLEILVEEVKTQITISQVGIELKNQIFSAITIKSMDIMHISVERGSIIRTRKFNISHTS
jgi:hypothetical protein